LIELKLLMTNDFASHLWCGVFCHLVERAESCSELLHFKGNHLAELLAEHAFLYINCLWPSESKLSFWKFKEICLLGFLS